MWHKEEHGGGLPCRRRVAGLCAITSQCLQTIEERLIKVGGHVEMLCVVNL